MDEPVYRFEIQEMRRLTIFLKSSTPFFYKNKSLGFGKKIRIS